MFFKQSLIYLCTALGAIACDTTESTSEDATQSSRFSRRPAPCDASTPPMVMVHGFIGAGDTWANFKDLFVANGKCANRYAVLDWNSLDMAGDHAAQLDRAIDQLLKTHDAEHVDLLGHSAGGGVSYTYLEDPTRAKKIRKYIHIASLPMTPPETLKRENIQMLNLYSSADYVVEGADIAGVNNRRLEAIDHYAVATSDIAFSRVFEFLYGQKPTTFVRPLVADPRVRGRAVSLGEATVLNQATVTAYAVDEFGQRKDEGQVLPVDEMGWWGPLDTQAGYRFELELRREDRLGTFRYFYQAFETDLSLVYHRSLPHADSPNGLVLYEVPQSGDAVSLVVFNASGAFLAGRDSLTLDGQELLTAKSASADQTAIALFIFDIDGDGEPDGQSPLFDSFPFLAAIDVPLTPDADASIELVFNGQMLRLPRDPASQGPMIAIFR
ncbi:MAG: alpha/beta fold hydrolase [Myxococcota bacterium]|nr:alpha/beta fold hydrolase [Myxococcota bacterium]